MNLHELLNLCGLEEEYIETIKSEIDSSCIERNERETDELNISKEELEEFLGTLSDLSEDKMISELILNFIKKNNLKI